MRIIKESNHDRMKITIFKYNDQYSIKCEQDQNEIYFKFFDSAINENQIDQYFLSEEAVAKYKNLVQGIADMKFQSLLQIEKEKGVEFPEII
jgi:hypothetical protein